MHLFEKTEEGTSAPLLDHVDLDVQTPVEHEPQVPLKRPELCSSPELRNDTHFTKVSLHEERQASESNEVNASPPPIRGTKINHDLALPEADLLDLGAGKAAGYNSATSQQSKQHLRKDTFDMMMNTGYFSH